MVFIGSGMFCIIVNVEEYYFDFIMLEIIKSGM